MSFDRVAVVGAGLIGGSVVRRLAALGRAVAVVDPDVAGAVPVVPPDADLVVVAVPLDVVPTVLWEVAEQAPDAVVVDVGSVKSSVVRSAAAAGLDASYVGAHPMAGTELSGFEHSAADLLVGATWAVTRGEGPVADVVRWVVDVFDATVVVLDPAAHDRAVALVSHLPHVLANALLEVVEGSADPAAAHLAAGSFRDGTRVAGRDADRTRNMLADNVDALGVVLDELVVLLGDYRHELDDPAALGSRLARVSDDAPVLRHLEPAWEPCRDLDTALVTGGAILVRRGAGGIETADP